LYGIAARPTEKLAAQIILFAFQTQKKLLKKIGIAPEFRSRPQSLFRALFISNLDRKSACDVHCIESKRLNDTE
jgi:hypothetical protein